MRSRTVLSLIALAFCATLPAQVVINEFNTGTPDFIELLNNSNATVDVSGWQVSSFQGDGAGPLAAETAFTIPAGTMIAPQQLLVLEEFGTSGAVGTLGACSIEVGFNYNWTATRNVAIAVSDSAGTGVDYVYRNNGGPTGNPNIPAGLTFTGVFSMVGNEVARSAYQDTDSAMDWFIASGASPCTLNPGQVLISYTVSTTGVGDVSWSLQAPLAPNAEFFALYSLEDNNGNGPLLGVGFDVLPQLSFPLIPNTPFHSLLNGSGELNLSYGPGTLPAGLSLESIAVVLSPIGALVSTPIEINF